MTEEVSKLDRLSRVCKEIIKDGYPTCDICNSFVTSNYDFMITCMNCNVQVHTECWPHGSMHSFECPKCQFCREFQRPVESIQCMICPVMTGFMTYSTREGHWVHLSCLKTLDHKNKGVCMYCGDDYGSTMRCQLKSCSYNFHIKCMELRGYTEISFKNRSIYACRHHYQAHKVKIKHHKQSSSKNSESAQKSDFHSSTEQLKLKSIQTLKRAKLKQLQLLKKNTQKSPEESQTKTRNKLKIINNILSQLNCSESPHPTPKRYKSSSHRGRPSNSERISRKHDVISAMLKKRSECMSPNIAEILRTLLNRDDIMPIMCAGFRNYRYLLDDSNSLEETQLELPDIEHLERWELASKDFPAKMHKTFEFMLLNKRIFTIQVPVHLKEVQDFKQGLSRSTERIIQSMIQQIPLSSFPEKVLEKFSYLSQL